MKQIDKYNKVRGEIKEKKKYLKSIRLKMNRDLKRDYNFYFRIMDCFVVLIILFNFGALTLTKLLVVHQTPTENRKFYEVNPVASKVHGFEGVPEENKGQVLAIITGFIFVGLFWTVLLFSYILSRNNIFKKFQLSILLFMVCFYFSFTGMDFFNNFGLWLGTFT